MIRSRKRRSRRKRSETRRLGAPGAAPGALTPVEGSPPARISWVRYTADELEEGTTDDLSGLAELRGRGGVLWVDVCGLGDVAALEAIGQLFGLHALALEDVVHVPQRPKIEDYGDHLFAVARRALMDETRVAEQVSFFVGRDFLVSFREEEDDWIEAIRIRIREGRPRLRQRGADYLFYALLDVVVDYAFPVVEHYGDRLDQLEERILQGAEEDAGTEIQGARHDLLQLRRALWPLREALAVMMRGDFALIEKDTRVYLRDCEDHTVRILELVDVYRDLAAGLMDLHIATLSQRMNEVMKTLTIIATLFIPLSFIAGLYGMNFDSSVSPWNMPELRWSYGYPGALALMAMVAGSLLLYFRRKGWLGGPPRGGGL